MKWVLRIVAVMVALPVLGSVVLLAMGQRSGAGHARAFTEIQAPPDHIWPWLEEEGRVKQWVTWLVEIRGGENGFQRAGAKRVWVMRDENNGGALVEMQVTCTEYAPPAYLAVRTSTAGMFDGLWGYRLTDLGNGRTRLESDGQYEFQMWFARLMEPLITPQAARKMRGDLARLKELVEKAETRGPAPLAGESPAPPSRP